MVYVVACSLEAISALERYDGGVPVWCVSHHCYAPTSLKSLLIPNLSAAYPPATSPLPTQVSRRLQGALRNLADVPRATAIRNLGDMSEQLTSKNAGDGPTDLEEYKDKVVECLLSWCVVLVPCACVRVRVRVRVRACACVCTYRYPPLFYMYPAHGFSCSAGLVCPLHTRFSCISPWCSPYSLAPFDMTLTLTLCAVSRRSPKSARSTRLSWGC
jgi:hypothetical protein